MKQISQSTRQIVVYTATMILALAATTPLHAADNAKGAPPATKTPPVPPPAPPAPPRLFPPPSVEAAGPPTNAPPVDYARERHFAQRMLEQGVEEFSLRGERQSHSGPIRKLPEFDFTVNSIVFGPGENHSADDLRDAAGLHNLIDLTVDCPKLNDEGFSHLARPGTLRVLRLGRNSRISPELIGDCRDLAIVTLNQVPDTAACLPQVARLPSLKSLVIEYPRMVTADLSILKQTRELQQLELANCALGNDALAAIGKCPDLRWLRVQKGGIELEDGSANSLPELQSLALLEMSITGRQLSRLIAAAPGLKRLEFWQVRSDPEGWQRLAESKSLRLQLSRCNIHDDDLRYLPASLEELVISETIITGWGFQKHADGFPRLRLLDLSSTPLTNDGLELVLKSAPKIRTLHVNSTNLTPAGFDAVAKLPALEFLWMFHMQDPDACLLKLQPAPTLKQIAAEFSREARAEFLKSHPDCVVP